MTAKTIIITALPGKHHSSGTHLRPISVQAQQHRITLQKAIKVESVPTMKRALPELSSAPTTLPRKRERLTHLSPEEKLNRRKMKNRIAAQTARDRKKVKMNDLEDITDTLSTQNEELLDENETLKARNEALERENALLKEELKQYKKGKQETGKTIGSAESISDLQPRVQVKDLLDGFHPDEPLGDLQPFGGDAVHAPERPQLRQSPDFGASQIMAESGEAQNGVTLTQTTSLTEQPYQPILDTLSLSSNSSSSSPQSLRSPRSPFAVVPGNASPASIPFLELEEVEKVISAPKLTSEMTLAEPWNLDFPSEEEDLGDFLSLAGTEEDTNRWADTFTDLFT